MILSFLSNLFFSSTLAQVISSVLQAKTRLSLFGEYSYSIPSFSSQLASEKTYDILNYALFILIAGVLLWFNLKFRKKPNIWLDTGYFIISFFFYLQVHFLGYSSLTIVIGFLAFQVLFWVLNSFSPNQSRTYTTRVFLNSIFLSVSTLLIVRQFNYSLILPFSALVIVPLIYYYSHDKISRLLAHPFHILLIANLFFPSSLDKLLVITLTVLIASWLTRNINILRTETLSKHVYPLAAIFLIAFNPMYYLGTIDSVEEGFWLGWLNRIIHGEILYRDVWVYHPPLLIWLLGLFSKVVGASVANVRLYFHLLQILGFWVFYLVICNLTPSKILRALVTGLIIAFSFTLVKNNVEIRMASGLLAILGLYLYWQENKLSWLIITGAALGISIFTSVEVGLSAFASILISLVLSSRVQNLLKTVSRLGLGILMVATPIIIFLGYTKSLTPFVNQITYYSHGFSSGYFNLPIDKTETLPLFKWGSAVEFFTSSVWLWDLTRIILISGAVFAFYKTYTRQGTNEDKLAFAISLFGIIIFRAALGRSDWYHLLFPLWAATLILGYLAGGMWGQRPWGQVVTVLAFVLFFSKDLINLNFMTQQFYKWQSYGIFPGTYSTYTSPRLDTIVSSEVDTSDFNDLIEFVDRQDPQRPLFSFPWMPELYFITRRGNPTKNDTPYAFYSPDYQTMTVAQLRATSNVLIVYNPEMKFSNMSPDSIAILKKYITDNFYPLSRFGSYIVMEQRQKI